MKVVSWTFFGDERYPEKFPFCGLGAAPEEIDAVDAAIVDALREGGYHFPGYYHQNPDDSAKGVPVLDDGRRCEFTFRTWGAIMAQAYPDEMKTWEGMEYCKWAWGVPEGEALVVPE